MRYSHIIWDFNGTILDDVDASIQSKNAVLARSGLPLIESVEYYRSIFTFPIIDYYRRLGHDFEKESYDELADAFMAEYLVNARRCGLCAGVEEALAFFRAQGVRQVIISASEEMILRGQLASLGILDCFDEILGLDNVKAYGKLDIARAWWTRTQPQHALLVGDTLHDHEVAAALGADCVLMALGHQSRERLEGAGVPVCDTYGELLALLKDEHA